MIMWSIMEYLIPLKIKRHALSSHPREEGGDT
jgi:hypothetical protein